MSLARRSLVFTVAATLAATLIAAQPAAADTAPVPGSMAGMGDSITRAFNACGFYVDCPSRSFSTGTTGSVNSHYLRIRAANPAIAGRNHNDARSGAKAADMPAQASTVAGRGVDYVTILIGANDACTGTEAGMTPVATFRGHIDAALARLKAGVPDARILVISIPDLRRLWTVGKDNVLARSAWSLLGICQSMLANPRSTAAADVARRERVRQRVVDFNAQLADACAGYGPNCRFDGNAVFNYPFTLAHISGWDYFHPDADGQAVLARVSSAAGFDWVSTAAPASARRAGKKGR
jgi:lysophospholipase L1-like esterase